MPAPDPISEWIAAHGHSLDVSVVMACRNEAARIRECLDSLLAQQWDGLRWEALIADGGSNDSTRAVLEDYSRRHSNLRWLDNPGRIVSTGLNLAIRASRGAIVIRMDAHSAYHPDYCRRCLVVLLLTSAANAGGPARTLANGLCARAVAAAYHSPFSTGGARFHDENFQGWVDTVPYGCWRRETLFALGLFDESLVRNQDDELNLRLVRSGAGIWQDPSIQSWYRPRSTLRGLFLQYFQYGYWKTAVLRKHHTPASWRHLVPPLFVLGNLVLPLAALPVWTACAASYAILLAGASLASAARRGWDLLPLLPAAFLTFHLSYGLGMLAGFVLRPGQERPADSETLFSRLSR